MNNKLKTGILLIMLAIPVFIWLFLKFFGSNNFDLPVYYLNGIDSLAYCGSKNKPHTIPEFDFTLLTGEKHGFAELEHEIIITFFLPDQCDADCTLVLEQLANIQNVLLQDDKVRILVIANENHSLDELGNLQDRYTATEHKWDFVQGSSDELEELKKCGFVLSGQANYSLILTDNLQRIRGYYQATQAEEIDRLKGEVKILEYMQEGS